jgi:hypothetical protein
MNQIMPIGKGVIIAIDQNASRGQIAALGDMWSDKMPDVPAIFISDAQIVQRGEITLFEFTGNISPTMVAEFQLWWEGVTHDGQ